MTNPHRYLQVYTVLACLISVGSLLLVDLDVVLPVVIALVVFGVNLWGGIWSARVVVNSAKAPDGGDGGILQMFVGLKFFLFISSIIVIFLAFGWVPVLISNSLIILTVVFTTLYYAIFPEEDV